MSNLGEYKDESGRYFLIYLVLSSPMGRPLRLEFAGALYHVTALGERQEPIFLTDHGRRKFLNLLVKEVTQQGWRCYTYCLIANHYHLLIETRRPNLVRGMRRLNGVYTHLQPAAEAIGPCGGLSSERR